MTDPYGDNAHAYLAAGWHPFPLPYGKKIPPPPGFTGYTAVPVTRKHVDAWIAKAESSQNIGLHLPETVLGIDVDHYGDKTGAYTLGEFEEKLGTLPDTWVSSSRDGLSGIRFYRVPAGRMWVGQLAHQGSVDIISHHERFAVIWPSAHPEGGTYAWTDPDGFPSGDVPSVDLLPELPAAWVAHLDKGPLSDRDLKADLHQSEAWQWLEDSTLQGDPCRWLRRVIADAAVDLRTGNDHHGAVRGPVMTVVRAGEQGHVGALAALEQLRDIFEDSLVGHRSWDEHEWVRLVVGAAATCTVEDQRTDFEDRGCCPEDPPEVVDLGEEPGEDYVKGASWQEVNLESVLDGSYERPAQTIGSYGEGALFYPGMVNGVAGESGAGKSWVALVCCAQEIGKGRHVVYVDYEADIGSVVHRMLDIGVQKDDLREFFHYVHPFEKIGPEAKDFFMGGVVGPHRPSLVVIDSTGESMAMEGTKPNDDDDVATWFRNIANPIARTGAAVLLLDHTVKAQDGGLWPIGSQRKRAAISTQYILRIDQPYDRETSGGSNLICAKDRHGNYAFARLVCRLDVANHEGDLSIDLIDIQSDDTGERGLSALERRILLYVDERMREVHGQLDDEDEIMEGRPNKEKIKKDVRGKNAAIIEAIDHLVDRNLLLPVEVKTGKRATQTLYEPGVRDFDIVED